MILNYCDGNIRLQQYNYQQLALFLILCIDQNGNRAVIY